MSDEKTILVEKMADKKTETMKSDNDTLNILCFQINKVMLRFKAHFFLYIGAMGCVLIYIPIIARNRLGMSATALAAALTAELVISIFTKPIIGYIADYFNRLKIIITALIIIQTVSFFLLLLIPPIRTISVERTSTDIIKIFDVSAEYNTVAIRPLKYCDKSSETPVASTVSSIKERKEQFVDSSICVFQNNKTELFCFIKDSDPNHSYTKTTMSFCCLLSISHIDLYNLTLNEERSNNYFRLIPIEHDSKLHNANQSFMCNLENDSDYQSMGETTIKDFETLQYWMFAILHLVNGICIGSIFTLVDTACMESVQKHGGDFGRQRLYGAIGWGTLAPIGGLLCDLTSDYLAAWILVAVLLLLSLLNCYHLDFEKQHYSQNIFKDVSAVLKSGLFLAFELGVFMNGIGVGIIWFYLVWFITGLGGSKFLCGLIQYVQCFAGEIPFMFFSAWFINRFGHMNLISASLICYAIRFIWYSYLHNPWLVLPIEIVHGITYGTFYPTVTSFGKLNAKPGTEATTQSVLFATYEGLGAAVGCIVAGIGFDYFGGHTTFFYVGLFFTFGSILNIINTFLTSKRNKV